MSGVYVLDATGALKQTGGGGGLTSPVGIADGGTGQTSKTPAFDALSPTTTTGDLIYYNGTDNVRLGVGSAGQVLTVSGGAPAWANRLDYILIQEQQAASTNGGTFTAGAWQTRTLNTEVSDAGGKATLASNQITLAAGTYIARVWASASLVNQHQVRLQDITNTATLLLGESAYAASTGQVTSSRGEGIFTIAGSTVIELQHYCTTTRASSGFGTSNTWGTNVYSSVELIKVA